VDSYYIAVKIETGEVSQVVKVEVISVQSTARGLCILLLCDKVSMNLLRCFTTSSRSQSEVIQIFHHHILVASLHFPFHKITP